MLKLFKSTLTAIILGGILVTFAPGGAQAQMNGTQLAEVTKQVTKQFIQLVKAGDMDALIAWLNELAEQYPDDFGEIIVQLNDLVADDDPNFDLIIAALADQLATAAGGGPPGGQVLPPGFANANPRAIQVTSENPSVVSGTGSGG